MRRLQAKGYLLVLNTCREDEPRRKYLTEAVVFCAANGVHFRSVNCNLPEDDFREHGGRKIFAHYYIDDRNLGGFPGWLEVERMMREQEDDPQLVKLWEIEQEIKNVKHLDQKEAANKSKSKTWQYPLPTVGV